MTIKIAPCTVKAATKKVGEWHLGVAVFGNPCQEWQGTGRGARRWQAGNGTPTPKGYRQTCFEHRP